MTRIWLDTLANALCLMMTLRIAGRPAHRARVTAAALLGAVSAQAVRPAGRAIAVCFWLPVAACMTAAASGTWSLRMTLLLLACEGFLGGTIGALSGALGSLGAAWCAGAAFALVMSANAIHVRRRAADTRMVRLRITCGERTAEFHALVDSGNCLRDYLTHRPVIVLPESARARLGLCGAPLRPIFADTAGGRQMMDCVTPRSVVVIEGGHALAVSACAAFSPGLPARAPALLPQSLLNGHADLDESRADREGKAYGKTESRSVEQLGAAGNAAGAVHHQTGGDRSVYRRKRFAAGAAEPGGRDCAVLPHGDGAERREKDAH